MGKLDELFLIATRTPYCVNDMIDFMALTGFNLKQTEILMNRFSDSGISNLKDVNTLAKMGYLSISILYNNEKHN